MFRAALLGTFCGLLLAGAFPALSQNQWRQEQGYRWRPLNPALPGKVGFQRLTGRDLGLSFSNMLRPDLALTNQIFHNGSGVALGDIDGDGLCDVYLGHIDGTNRLYRNLGNWKFEDITERAGVGCPGWHTTGVLLVDVNGDGHLDLLVNAIGHGTALFINDGHGHFTDVTKSSGLRTTSAAISMALADARGNGALDLFVTNYRKNTLRDEPFTQFSIGTVNGRQTITAVNGKSPAAPDLLGRFTYDPVSGIVEHGEPAQYYRGDGHGKFSAVPWTNGIFLDEAGKPITTPYDWGLSVVFRDFTGDGLPDIYVCNDFDAPDRIWVNQGNGKFRLIDRLAVRHTSLFSMGVDVADIDRDGHDDIFVLDMLSREHVRRQTQLGYKRPYQSSAGMIDNRPQYMQNTLLWNRGDGTFGEIAAFSGVEATEWSWTPIFLDVDLDGFEDLLVSNGHLRDAQNSDIAARLEQMKREKKMSALEQLKLRTIYPVLTNKHAAFRNRGNLTFEEKSAEWGFDVAGVTQGMALADLDGDGGLDVVVNNLNGGVEIFHNTTANPRVAVRLKGIKNTVGIGAKISLFGGAVPVQSQEMISGGRFLSSDDSERVFAAGSATSMRLEVAWPSGRKSVIQDVRANREYEVAEAAAAEKKVNPPAKKPAALFRDVSGLLNHSHREIDFDDFARQPSISRKLSQLGPGISWADFDGDGNDDLIIPAAKNGVISLFKNNGAGGFQQLKTGGVALDDQTTALAWVSSPGNTTLMLGQASYESGQSNAVGRFEIWAGGIDAGASLAGDGSSAGPMALADYRGDGSMGLFVGGRVLPGRYPEAASSRLFFFRDGKFEPDKANNKILQAAGLVSGAIFSDLDGDGFPELLLACEWGPIRVFQNDHGRFVDATARLKLQNLSGWWNSVAVGDFDGDGKLDIVAGNWGINTKYQRHRERALQIVHGNWGDVHAAFESYYEPALNKYVPWSTLDRARAVLPFLTELYPTHDAFAHAGAGELFGGKATQLQTLEANTLESMVFLNRGDHFEIVPLPLEAQLSPVFGVVVADFNGDGIEDLFLAQNFFAVAPDETRFDAGRGLVLLGKGDGHFTPLTAEESGIAVYGEQRGAAVADYDRDGRIDLAVTQNGSATRLFHNETGTPGLRVRLSGPPQNGQAIGSAVRLVSAGKSPIKETHAGTGYWSQDSASPILTGSGSQLWIRWPGGATNVVAIPEGAREIQVNSAGTVQKIK